MPKNIELLLVESVENLGIVGDVVKVRTGYARNLLLPRQLATTPSPELIKSLQARRAAAVKEVAELRTARAGTIEKLKGFELTIERSTNDQGILYGGITQQEIADGLVKAGHAVRPRDVRLSHAIKRVDTYEVHIKYETELETYIKLHVKSDRVLAKDEKPDLDFDNEGNLIEKGAKGRGRGRGGRGEEGAEGAEGAEGKDGAKADGKHDGKHADKKHDAHAAKPEAKKVEGDRPEEKAQKATRKPREDVKKPAAPAKKA